jgi:hypothetical protein
MTLTQLPLRHTTRISTMRKTCHKNYKREKKKIKRCLMKYIEEKSLFTSSALFYIMTSLPAFVKVGKTPATQNLALEKYAVKIGKSTLFLYDI